MSEERTYEELFGDLDPNGDVWTREDNLREMRALCARLGASSARVTPGTVAAAHLADTGHLLRFGCCQDAHEARTDARPTTPGTRPGHDSRTEAEAHTYGL